MKRIIWGTAITAAALPLRPWASAPRPGRRHGRARPTGTLPRLVDWVRGLSHAKEDGTERSEPDLSRMLSGHPEGTRLPPPPAASGPWAATATWDLTAWSGPWGVSYAMNITPDQNTGIGIWTEDMFLSGPQDRPAHGRVAADPAADAMAGVPEPH